MQVSGSTLSVLEIYTQVLHLVDCNRALESEEFQFSLIDDFEKKRIELHALGKSGFHVAIGPIQMDDPLARTVTIKLNVS